MADDPVIQMASDPEFGKMPLAEQQKALSAHDPGFSSMGPADITRFVQAHQTSSVPSFTDAANQSKQQITSLPMKPSALGGAYPTTQQDQYINERLPMVNQRVADIRKQALAAAGASFGTGAVAGGSGLLPGLLRMGGAGAGAAAGNVAGAVISGQKPDAQEALTTGGAFATGEGVSQFAVSPLLKWMGASKTLGAKLLQQASAKAGEAPVELSPETNKIVEQITQQGGLGGTTPKFITDLLNRLGPSTRHVADAAPGPLTYDEARILQSSASGMSVQERLNLNGRLKYLVPQFAKSFARDVQAAADQAGIGTEHAQGMKEFATAMAKSRTLEKLGDIAKPAIKGAIGGGAGAAAGYEVYRALKGQK